MKDFISTIDFIGQDITFTDKNSKRHKSLPGALFSIAVVISSVVVGSLFGKEIYERKIPLTSNSKEFIDSSAVFLQDLPILFDFKFNNGTSIENFLSYFFFYIEIITYDNNNNAKINTSITMKPCNFTKYKTNSELISKNHINDTRKYFCPDFNNNTYFMNTRTTQNSTLIRINVLKCQNKFFPCAKEDESTAVKLISISYIDSYADPGDYSNPIHYFEDRISIPTSNSIQKIYVFNFLNNILISDNGWLLEDTKTFNHIGLDNIDAEYSFLDSSTVNQVYLTSIFHSSKLRNKVTRNYMKVQELFAKVGGIVNIFLILVKIITFHYLEFKFLIKVGKYLILSNNQYQQMNEGANSSKVIEKSKQIPESIVNNNVSQKPLAINETNTNNIATSKFKSKTAITAQNPSNLISNFKYVSEQNNFTVKNMMMNISYDNISKFSYCNYMCHKLFCKNKKKQDFELNVYKIIEQSKYMFDIQFFIKNNIKIF
jgi:hypothetical protein